MKVKEFVLCIVKSYYMDLFEVAYGVNEFSLPSLILPFAISLGVSESFHSRSLPYD